MNENQSLGRALQSVSRPQSIASKRRQRQRQAEASKQRWAQISALEKQRLVVEHKRVGTEEENLERWANKGMFSAIRRQYTTSNRKVK